MEKNAKKKYIVIGSIIVAVIALIILIVFLINKEEAYRVVRIYELDGKATVTRENAGEIDIYPNMVLTSGDEVCLQEGLMTLKLDEDKYVYVEENTRFSLTATGTASNSKTMIKLLEGAIINEIRSPLSEDASYEVHTQNSSMSVRGTTFRVAIYYDEDGTLYTKVSVFEGKVETQLVFKDGSKADPRMVEFGKETIIFEDDTNTDYLDGIADIKYEELSVSALETLIKLVKEGFTLSVSEDYLNKVLAVMKGESIDGDNVEPEEETQKDETDPSKGDIQETEGEQPESDSQVTKTDPPQQDSSEGNTEPEAGDQGNETGEDSNDDPEEETDVSYTVTFMYNGTKFATQTVASNGYASKPNLMPALTGSWDFDFSEAITEDTTINWK